MLSYNPQDRLWVIRGYKAKRLKKLVGKTDKAEAKHTIYVWQEPKPEGNADGRKEMA